MPPYNQRIHHGNVYPWTPLQLQLANNLVVVVQDLLAARGRPWLEVELEGAGLKNDVTVGGLGIDGDELASTRVPFLCRVESPECRSAKDKHLVIDNVLTQARPAAPAEGVHGLTLAEVGVTGEGLLESGPAGLEPALRAEVVTVGVDIGKAVDGPGNGVLERLSRGKSNMQTHTIRKQG